MEGGQYHHNDSHGIQWYTRNGTIRNALIYDNVRGPGLGLYGTGNTAYNNVLVRNGINMVAGQTLAHNTLWGHNPAHDYGIYQQPGTSSIIKNNLVLQQAVSFLRGYIYIDGGTGPSGNALADSVDQARVAGNLCDNSTMVGCASAPASPSPVVNTDAMDFHLRTGSPAVAAGVHPPDAAMMIDKDGVARPPTGAVDVGAYQYVSGGPTLPAPSNLRATVR